MKFRIHTASGRASLIQVTIDSLDIFDDTGNNQGNMGLVIYCSMPGEQKLISHENKTAHQYVLHPHDDIHLLKTDKLLRDFRFTPYELPG